MGEATMKLVRKQPRTAAILVAACLLAIAAFLVVSSTGRATSAASPYTLPPALDPDPAPGEASVDVGTGVTAHVQAYNGAIPGPTFRLKVGDTVIVHYRNELAHPS